MATVSAGTSGSAAALMEQTWRPRLAKQCNEETRIVNDFDDGNDGIGPGIGGTLNVRKILRIPASKFATGDSTGSLSVNLTYTANTELNIALTPTFAYGAVQINELTMVRLLAAPKLQSAYLQQILAGLKAQIDADGGALMNQLTTTVKGGGAQNVDKNFLLDGIGSLIEQCRELYEPGNGGWAFFKYHPRQYKNVQAISEITNAQIRGDSEKPVKMGWVWAAYGLKLMVTGSVLTSGGIAHNPLHIKDSHLIAYNQKPDFLPSQKFELVTRLIARTEYVVGEVWDEYAADMQTAA